MSLEMREKVYREMKKRFPDLRYNIFYPMRKKVRPDCILDTYDYVQKRFEIFPVISIEEVVSELNTRDDFPYKPQEVLSALLWIADHSKRERFLFLITDQGEFLLNPEYSVQSVFVTDELAEHGVSKINALITNPLNLTARYAGIKVNWDSSEDVILKKNQKTQRR